MSPRRLGRKHRRAAPNWKNWRAYNRLAPNSMVSIAKEQKAARESRKRNAELRSH
jgi:hypothetical protein